MGPASSQDPKSRRERGVMAQRAYRQRHATKFKQLQEENTRLRDAIQAIVEASGGHQIPANLQSAVSKAKATAEMEGESENSPDPPAARSRAQVAPRKDSVPNDAICAASGDDQPCQSEPGQHSPLLNSARYLGDNMFTIEGRLFWDYMTYVMLQLQRHILSDDHETVKSRSLQSEERIDQEFVTAMGSARFEYHQSTKPNADPSTFPPLMSKVAEKQRSFRSSSLARQSDFWKTPEQVAEYLVKSLTPEDTQILYDALGGKLSPEAERNVGRRLYSFARNAVCFGDGPRWSRLFLSLATGVWVSGTDGLDAYYTGV